MLDVKRRLEKGEVFQELLRLHLADDARLLSIARIASSSGKIWLRNANS
jgi:hypothetical protein